MSDRKRFQVIMDDGNREYFLNEADNGMRLHYEMQLVLRSQKKRLRERDVWADSREAVLIEMQDYFPDYEFKGSWKFGGSAHEE
jgi:hypothetical protein